MTNFINFFNVHGNLIESVSFITTNNAAEMISCIISNAHGMAVRFEIENEEGFVYHSGECH